MQSTDSVAAALAAVILAATVFKSSLMTVAAVTTPVPPRRAKRAAADEAGRRRGCRLQAASACQLPGCCGLCHSGVTCIESEALGCISVGC